MENGKTVLSYQSVPAAVLTASRLKSIREAAWSIAYISTLLSALIDRSCEEGLTLSPEEAIGLSNQMEVFHKAAAEISSQLDHGEAAAAKPRAALVLNDG